MRKLKNRLKGLFNRYTILLLFTYFVFGTGFSYAYFAYNYEDNTTIVGNVVAINATLNVELIVGTNGKLVPLKNSALSLALNGLENGGQADCIDSNGNLSCQVYKITLTNTGSRLQHINGSVELYAKEGTGNAYSNLKWQELTNRTTIKTDSIVNGMTKSILVSDLTMESGDTKEWYIAVWISEIDADQKNVDKGLFGGTVTFEAGDEVIYLNSVELGSYVAYTGDSANGCDNINNVNGWTSCSGMNARYESDSNMGYCNNLSATGTKYKFNANGWRIGYIEDGNVHLISAGSTDCVCTSSTGTLSTINNCSGHLSLTDINKHFENLDNIALKYCNINYVKDGVCNNDTVWALNDLDFQKITNVALTSCYFNKTESCGYGHPLIDNGGFYWLATQYNQEASSVIWRPDSQYTSYRQSGDANLFGLRPVIKLSSSVRIIGGTGEYTNPYIIANQ